MQYVFCVFVSEGEGVHFLIFLYELISRAEFRKFICQASSGSRHHLPKASIYDRGGIAAVSRWLDDLQALPYLFEMCSRWRWGEYLSVLSFLIGSILRACMQYCVSHATIYVAFPLAFIKHQVATTYMTLSMTAAVAKEVFVVSDDKLRVRASIADQLQERVLASSGPRAKGGDCVVSVDGVSGSPEVLLAACSSGASVVIQLQRDFGVVVFR